MTGSAGTDGDGPRPGSGRFDLQSVIRADRDGGACCGVEAIS